MWLRGAGKGRLTGRGRASGGGVGRAGEEVWGRGSAQRAARGRGRSGGRALCGGARACPRRVSPPRGLPRASRSRGRPPEGSGGQRGAGRARPPPRGLRRAPALLLRRVGRGGSVEEGQLRWVRGRRPRAPEVRGALVAGLRAEPARASPRRPPGAAVPETGDGRHRWARPPQVPGPQRRPGFPGAHAAPACGQRARGRPAPPGKRSSPARGGPEGNNASGPRTWRPRRPATSPGATARPGEPAPLSPARQARPPRPHSALTSRTLPQSSHRGLAVCWSALAGLCSFLHLAGTGMSPPVRAVCLALPTPPSTHTRSGRTRVS